MYVDLQVPDFWAVHNVLACLAITEASWQEEGAFNVLKITFAQAIQGRPQPAPPMLYLWSEHPQPLNVFVNLGFTRCPSKEDQLLCRFVPLVLLIFGAMGIPHYPFHASPIHTLWEKAVPLPYNAYVMTEPRGSHVLHVKAMSSVFSQNPNRHWLLCKSKDGDL